MTILTITLGLAAFGAAGFAAPLTKNRPTQPPIPETFLEYCQSADQSAEERHTLALLARKFDTDDCEKLDEVARTQRTLRLYNHNLVDVRVVKYFTEITTLFLSTRAQLRAEQLRPSPKLNTLLLDANIAALPYMGPNIEKLRLRHAKGVNLDSLGRYQKLKELWVQGVHTNTSFAGLSKLTALESVKIIAANVDSVAYLPKAPNLRTLILAEAGLDSLGGIPVMASLEKLDLSGNSIPLMEPLTSLHKLESIDLSGNPIKDIDCLLEFPELKEVQAASTGVTDWGFIEKMPKLEILNVANNDLDTAALAKLVNERTPLLRLDISGNDITDLAPLNWFDRIASVDASRNQLSILSRLPDTLWWLTANENRITDLSRYHGPALRYLSLKRNGLRNLTGLGHKTHLKELDLSFNQIDTLMPMKNYCCDTFIDLWKNPLGTTIEKTAENCPLDAKAKDIRLFCKY